MRLYEISYSPTVTFLAVTKQGYDVIYIMNDLPSIFCYQNINTEHLQSTKCIWYSIQPMFLPQKILETLTIFRSYPTSESTYFIWNFCNGYETVEIYQLLILPLNFWKVYQPFIYQWLYLECFDTLNKGNYVNIKVICSSNFKSSEFVNNCEKVIPVWNRNFL